MKKKNKNKRKITKTALEYRTQKLKIKKNTCKRRKEDNKNDMTVTNAKLI